MVCPVYIRVSHSNVTERDKVLADIGSFLRVEACKSKMIAIQKIVEYIEELRIPPHPNQPSAHKIRRQ